MKNLLKRYLPKPWIGQLRNCYFKLIALRLLIFGRPFSPGETSKAKARRIRENFFDQYCNGHGLDIGYGGDPVTSNCAGFDFENGDAQYLNKINDSSFDFVYSSHTLEHLKNPTIALENWWRVLKTGGYLILYLPERDLYEKKLALPSRWNLDHKRFFLLDRDDPPDTIGIVPLIKKVLPNAKIIYAKICKEGHTIHDPNLHSDGEYSIEVILKKQV